MNRIQETAPQCFVSTHCVAHRLPLASCDGCKEISIVSRFEWIDLNIEWTDLHIYCQKYNTCCWASTEWRWSWNWNRFLKQVGYPRRVQWIISDRVQGNTIEEQACYTTQGLYLWNFRDQTWLPLFCSSPCCTFHLGSYFLWNRSLVCPASTQRIPIPRRLYTC